VAGASRRRLRTHHAHVRGALVVHLGEETGPGRKGMTRPTAQGQAGGPRHPGALLPLADGVDEAELSRLARTVRA
jgi:hypothetical protein